MGFLEFDSTKILKKKSTKSEVNITKIIIISLLAPFKLKYIYNKKPQSNTKNSPKYIINLHTPKKITNGSINPKKITNLAHHTLYPNRLFNECEVSISRQ